MNGTVTNAPTTGLPAPIINPGSNALTGTLTFLNDLVEHGGAINHFDLSGNPSEPNNDFIIVTGNLTMSGTNVIETGGAPQNGAVYQLIQYGTFNGDLTNFTTLSGTLSNNVVNKIIYLIAQSNNHPPTNVTWLGNSVANNWDTLTTTNWSINGTGPATNFVSGDNARFDNTGAVNPLVNIVGGVSPGSVTVDSTSDYTFTGTGSIIGAGGLTKTSSGTVDHHNDQRLRWSNHHCGRASGGNESGQRLFGQRHWCGQFRSGQSGDQQRRLELFGAERKH